MGVKGFKKKMKLAIVLLLLVATVYTTPSCAASGYCMGCHASTANTCTACFNWGSGKVKARALASNTCANQLSTTAITDCKYYSGTNGGSTQTVDNCQMCNKDWLNINDNTDV